MCIRDSTRFTQAKHDQQKSPFQTLLKPKVGGLAMALETMGPQFDALVDVTIVYPGGVPTFWDLLTGKVVDVRVDIRQEKIPTELAAAEDASSSAYRAKLQAWIDGLWRRKDALIQSWRQG